MNLHRLYGTLMGSGQRDNMQPEPGFVTDVEIIRIIDADTFLVRMTREFPVRITDENKEPLIFDSPEKNTSLGKKARQYCIDMFLNKTARLCIPTNEEKSLTDINSFNRIIGVLWFKGKRITDILTKKGFGRFTKRKDRKTLWDDLSQ
jgi:hypothetical protein